MFYHYQVSKCNILVLLTTVWLNKLNWDIKRLVLGIESGLIEFIDLRPDLWEFEHEDIFLVFLKSPWLDPSLILNGVDHYWVAAQGVAQEGHVLLLIEGDDAVTF